MGRFSPSPSFLRHLLSSCCRQISTSCALRLTSNMNWNNKPPSISSPSLRPLESTLWSRPYLWVVQECFHVVDASSTSTPPIHLLLPAVRLSSVHLLGHLPGLLALLSSSILPSGCLALAESGLLSVALLVRPPATSAVGSHQAKRVVAVVQGRWRRTRSRSPLPKEASLLPVRGGPQQSPFHQAAHHHVSKVMAEILEIHPEENTFVDNFVFCGI